MLSVKIMMLNSLLTLQVVIYVTKMYHDIIINACNILEVRNLSSFASTYSCCNSAVLQTKMWTSFIHGTFIHRRTSWSRWETSCAVVDGDPSTSPTWWTKWAIAASSVAAGTTNCVTTTRARRAPGQSTTATRRPCRGRPHPHQKTRGAKRAKARERDKIIIIK